MGWGKSIEFFEFIDSATTVADPEQGGGGAFSNVDLWVWGTVFRSREDLGDLPQKIL